MNQPLFLQIVERLEAFLGKLPESIQKPVLKELTPMKELFLKQRPPRFVLTGSHKLPLQEVVAALFAAAQPGDLSNVLMEVFRWHNTDLGEHGSVTLLDARGADEGAIRKIEQELKRERADIFLHLVDGNAARPVLSRDLETLVSLVGVSASSDAGAKIIGVSVVGSEKKGGAASADRLPAQAKLKSALTETASIRGHVIDVLEVPLASVGISATEPAPAAARLMALLAAELPNEARVEMIRVSRNRQAQMQIAQTLVKSTSAICTAVGAQPIPLADLPILTTLQLVMVSGIMHLAGRDRSLRSATEFVAALGVNLGAGMVLREGTRAVLKFFPGWGNVLCGMVAGAGTYAVGRAAIAYFIEGVTLKDARRTYLASRRKKRQPQLLESATTEKTYRRN